MYLDERDELRDKEKIDRICQTWGPLSKIYRFIGWNLQRKQGIKEDYLAGQAVTCKMRAILTDWLVQVHSRFHLLPETLHMTILLLDRFLQVLFVFIEVQYCLFLISKSFSGDSDE